VQVSWKERDPGLAVPFRGVDPIAMRPNPDEPVQILNVVSGGDCTIRIDYVLTTEPHS
jgi:hypothetical protein